MRAFTLAGAPNVDTKANGRRSPVTIGPKKPGRSHATALEAAGIYSLNEGDKVTFVVEDDRKGRGKQAGQVQKA